MLPPLPYVRIAYDAASAASLPPTAYVWLFVNMISSERLNVGWRNVAIKCAVQTSRPSSNLGVIGPTSGSHTSKWRFAKSHTQNKSTSGSAGLQWRKSHHTALVDAAAPNSEWSCHAPTPLFRNSYSSRKQCRRPRDSPRAEVHSRPTRTQNFTPLAFSAAEKSVTVQTYNHTNTHTVN